MNSERRSAMASIKSWRRKWLATLALSVVALTLTAACDQGFAVAESGTDGASRPTPAIAFKTPRAARAPNGEITPTAGSEQSSPSETADPTAAPATEDPTTAPPVETASPAPAVERTLVPAVDDSTAAGETAPTGEISQDMESWLVAVFQDLTAGITAVRPFEFDPGLVVVNESNNLALIMPEQFLQAAFDSNVRSSYFVRALQIVDVTDPEQLRRPALISELVLVHATAADASAYTADYRDFAVPLLGSFSEQFIQENFPGAERDLHEDSGFGLAEEEFILVGEYDLGDSAASGRPQMYIVTGRQQNVNIGLMILYLDAQSRMRPYGLFDRLVSKVG